MIDLLILYVLMQDKNSIYGIKQKIEEDFSFLLKVSFGALHPAIKKLENNKYVTVKKQLSSGGQRKSTYTITESGKEYFKKLMCDELPDNLAVSNQLINVKIMALGLLDNNAKLQTVNSILNFLEYQKINFQNCYDSNQEMDSVQKKFLSQLIFKVNSDIQWISALNENIDK